MQLQLQTFTTLVQNMAAAAQSAASHLIDLTVGSTLRAVLEANASLGLWLQWLILKILQNTRAATSDAVDLDSWMADFSFNRLPAVPSKGTATFSRFTATNSAFIPVGALVRTADGTQTFVVSAAASNPALNATQSGYTLPAGIIALDLPIQAKIPGTAGNIQAASVSLIVTAMPGVDTVLNAQALQGGLDFETDDAFRARFTKFFDSRSRGTPLAVGYAISNIQQNLQFAIQENVDPSGSSRMGCFVVTVDDGSGSPSAALLATAAAAVDAVRPVGSFFTIQPPTIVFANITLSITTPSGGIHTAAIAATGKAIIAYVNGLPIGAPLPLTKLAQLAYSADPGITNVSQITINALVGDITPSAAGVIKAGIVTIN